MKKATILRNLKIRKVDLVDQGANQHAHIQLTKRKNGDEPTNPTNPSPDNEQALFGRFGAFIAKMFNLTPAGSAAVAKSDAKTFAEVKELDATYDAVYRVTCAISDSIFAIINDTDDAEDAEKGCKPGKTKKSFHKEGAKDMKFDENRMTPEEKAQFEDLKKRYAIEDEPADPPANNNPATDPILKALQDENKATKETLAKLTDAMETEHLTQVAKRYEILGKTTDELVPLLKSMKAAGGDVYDTYIKTMDEHKALLEKSGLFSEIGKNAKDVGASPWQQIEAVATEIMKSAPTMTRAAAIDKACEQHPELVSEYEKSLH